MRKALRDGFLDATEIADYLAAKGVPFREAHHVSGRLVALCVRTGRVLPELTLEELRAEHPGLESDIFAALDPETIVERRNVLGGPARAQVLAQISDLEQRLAARGQASHGVRS